MKDGRDGFVYGANDFQVIFYSRAADLRQLSLEATPICSKPLDWRGMPVGSCRCWVN